MRVTPRQAAKELGVSTDTLRRWAEEGRITVETTAGGHRRYDLTEIRRMLAGPRDESAAADASSLIIVDDPEHPRPGIVPLGTVHTDDTGQAVAIRTEDLNQHLLITGRTGTGKTELLKRIAVAAAATNPLLVIDQDGDLADGLLHSFCARHPEFADKTVLVNFADPEHPVSWNPLDVRSLPEVQAAVNALCDMFALALGPDPAGSPRHMMLIKLALSALAEANLHLPRPETKLTLLQLPLFFYDTEFRQLVVTFCAHQGVQEMFDSDTGPFECWSAKQQGAIVRPIVRICQSLTADPAFVATFATPQNRFDLGQLLADRKNVLVKLPVGYASDSAGRAIGSLLLSTLVSAQNERGFRSDLPGVRVIVDEPLSMISYDSAAIRILAEARKYDLGFVFAAQQLVGDASMIKALLANTASRLTFSVNLDTARPLAESFDPTGVNVGPDDLMSLRFSEMLGVFRTGWEGADHHISPPVRMRALLNETPQLTPESAQHVVRRRRASQTAFAPAPWIKWSLEATRAALTVVHQQGFDAEMLPDQDADPWADQPVQEKQPEVDSQPSEQHHRLALVVDGVEAIGFDLDGEPPAKLFDKWRYRIEDALAATIRDLDQRTDRTRHNSTVTLVLDELPVASFVSRTTLHEQHDYLFQLQDAKNLLTAAAIDINRALKPADPADDGERDNLWPEDPRYMGMFTVEGNQAVGELVSDVIRMARHDAPREGIEEALRNGLKEIELVHKEAGDSAVRDRVTDVLCAAWGIETEYRLRFEQYDQRQGKKR